MTEHLDRAAGLGAGEAAGASHRGLDTPNPWPTILGFAGVRLALNTYIRFPFTFVTAFSNGLGLPIATTTTLLGLRELPGLATPALGRWVDRGHEKRTIAVATFAAAASCAATATANVPVLVVAMIVGGLAANGLVMAHSAWVGHRVPFSRRSRAVGIVEVSWAAALLLGAPACAWLIDRWGWRAPFYVVAVSLFAVGTVSLVRLPADRTAHVDEPRRTLRSAFTRRGAGLFCFCACQPFAQMMVFAVYGDWFATRFDMSIGAVGASTVLLGGGELTGTLLTAGVADRVGPRRSVMVGSMVAAPLAASLALVGGNAAMAIVALVVFAAGIEFSFVSAIPLMTEIHPDARGLTVGVAFGLATVGRAIASPVSGWVYERFGMGANGCIAGVALVAGVAAMGVGLRGQR